MRVFKRPFHTVLVGAVLVVLAGLLVTAARPVTTPLSAASAHAVIPSEGPGPPVAARVGQPVTVTIELKSGTGHIWRPREPLPPGVRLLDTAFAAPGGDGGKLGGPARQLLTFVVEQPGTTEVTLILKRSWEAETARDPRVNVTFHTTD